MIRSKHTSLHRGCAFLMGLVINPLILCNNSILISFSKEGKKFSLVYTRGFRRHMSSSIRILFADDDLDIQQAVCFVLEEAGMDVHFASDGFHALELYRSTPVNLVILDMMMPIMDGLETCQKIRQVSSIPIIMLTARGREEDVVTAFEMGADDYIVKPFRPRELVARIHAVLKRACSGRGSP